MQTSYSQDPVAGLPGQISSGNPHSIDTRLAQGALFFGLYAIAGALVPGSTEKYARHPTAAFDPEDALGIVHLDPSVVMPQDATPEDPPYLAGHQAGIVRRGKVWAKFEVDPGAPDAIPEPDTPVYVRTVAAVGKPAGGLRSSATETLESLALTVVTTADGAELELEVNGVDLSWTSGSSQSAAQKATAYAAYVDGLPGFNASAAGAVVTITHESGAIEVGDDHSESSVFTFQVTTVQGSTIAVLAPRAYWRKVPGGEVAEIELI